MFEHQFFDNYDFENVPLNRDIYLMGERWISEYETSFLNLFQGGIHDNVGYISYAAVNAVGPMSIELSWYPNIFDRFHEVKITLPKDQFVTCVGCSKYDEKLHIFVKDIWLETLHLRAYSVFAMVDAIGVKQAINNGNLTREKLIELRNKIDLIAESYPAISFISFADSLLLKSNWSVGMYNTSVKYSYEPEVFMQVLNEIRSVYNQVLEMEIYAILTQGNNEYYDDSLLHISSTRNHISLNSLGLPFAQLQKIDEAVRKAIKSKSHRPCTLYMDENFYRSLRSEYKFKKEDERSAQYDSLMTTRDSFYFYGDLNLPNTN